MEWRPKFGTLDIWKLNSSQCETELRDESTAELWTKKFAQIKQGGEETDFTVMTEKHEYYVRALICRLSLEIRKCESNFNM